MKKYFFFLTFPFLFIGAGYFPRTSSMPGDPVKEAKIIYDIDLSSSDMDQMVKDMMAGSTLTISFKDRWVKTVMNMNVSNTAVIMDGATDKGLMLMEMMTMKMAIRLEKDDIITRTGGDQEQDRVEYFEETKTIAGYVCKKSKVTDSEGNSSVYWYSDQIMPGNRKTQFSHGKLNGFPLEMQLDVDGMTMKMTAKEVKTGSLPADEFSMAIPAGYKESTMEDLMQMGGMGR